MALTKPIQQLRRDLKEPASLLKWSGVDLMQMSERMSEAGLEDDARALLTIAISYQDTEDKLAGYAKEVRDQRITRAKQE